MSPNDRSQGRFQRRVQARAHSKAIHAPTGHRLIRSALGSGETFERDRSAQPWARRGVGEGYGRIRPVRFLGTGRLRRRRLESKPGASRRRVGQGRHRCNRHPWRPAGEARRRIGHSQPPERLLRLPRDRATEQPRSGWKAATADQRHFDRGHGEDGGRLVLGRVRLKRFVRHGVSGIRMWRVSSWQVRCRSAAFQWE